jgi:hypothetical protein
MKVYKVLTVDSEFHGWPNHECSTVTYKVTVKEILK